MTDETKGDGMTLEHASCLLGEIIKVCRKEGKKKFPIYALDAMQVKAAIDAHLAAQSAMRVDKAITEKAEILIEIVRKQCGGFTSGPGKDAFDAAIDLRAAIQAALVQKED
jgi:hypothetical protein